MCTSLPQLTYGEHGCIGVTHLRLKYVSCVVWLIPLMILMIQLGIWDLVSPTLFGNIKGQVKGCQGPELQGSLSAGGEREG